MHNRRTDLVAWAAGVFEGEGCFGCYARKTPKGALYFDRSAILSSTDEDVVRRLAKVVGCGNVTGPQYHRNEAHKPYWTWRISSWDALTDFINAGWPYWSARRKEQAQRILDNPPKRWASAKTED